MFGTNLRSRLFVVSAAIWVGVVNFSIAEEMSKTPEDLVGSWIVKVDGSGKNRSMVVTNVSKRLDGIYSLEAKFGWVGSENPVVSAEVEQTNKGLKLSLTSKSGARVQGEQTLDGSFVGGFFNLSGDSVPMRITKAPVPGSSSSESTVALQTTVTTQEVAATAKATVEAPVACTTTDQCIQKPNLKIGDRWVFRDVDQYNNDEIRKFEHKITGLIDNDIRAEQVIHASKVDSNVGRPIRRTADRATWTFADNRILDGKPVNLAFPLEVGKKWSYAYKRTRTDSGTTDFNAEAKVTKVEEIQVPAGKFNAYRVEHTIAYSSNQAGQSWSDRVIDIRWYAPEVRNYVKRSYDGGRGGDKFVTELIEYEVK